MKPTTTRRIASLLALAILALPWAVRAQGEVEFEEADVIEGSPENAARMANFLRIADNSILDYVTRSTQSIQQGHRQGFADFRDWYRTRRAEEAEREATQELLRSLVGTALGAGLNVIFPGSGTFMEKLREYSVAAYEFASDHLGSVSSGDINQFLDRHESSLEAVITGLLDVPETFRDDAGEELEAAKWEFVFEAMDRDASAESPSSEVGPRTRRLLRNMGIPEPGSATAAVYRQRILVRQIYGVFSQDHNLRISWSDGDMRNGAEASALRHLYPGQPNRYCPAEVRLNNFFWSEECRNWYND